MSKKTVYICENEYGDDPCEVAVEGRRLSDSEVELSIEGTPRCPGKTRSGKECGNPLVPIPVGPDRDWVKLAFIGGGILTVLALIVFAGYQMLGSGGTPLIDAEPATLTFPKTEAGAATATLRVRNNGDGELIIERIAATPPVFSISEENIRIEPDSGETLLVHFKSPSADMTEGELLLYSNAEDSPTTIRLVANQDPWWVYKWLEESSEILSTGP